MKTVRIEILCKDLHPNNPVSAYKFSINIIENTF